MSIRQCSLARKSVVLKKTENREQVFVHGWCNQNAKTWLKKNHPQMIATFVENHSELDFDTEVNILVATNKKTNEYVLIHIDDIEGFITSENTSNNN